MAGRVEKVSVPVMRTAVAAKVGVSVLFKLPILWLAVAAVCLRLVLWWR